MTKQEFQLLITSFELRRTEILMQRDLCTGNGIDKVILRNYIQGGIDTLTTIIESLEKRYQELIT